MDRIQEVCFAQSIPSANAYNALRKMKLACKVIFKLENGYGLNEQAQDND